MTPTGRPGRGKWGDCGGLWHLPVVDSLGAVSPTATLWALSFLAFVSC